MKKATINLFLIAGGMILLSGAAKDFDLNELHFAARLIASVSFVVSMLTGILWFLSGKD